MTDLRLWIEKSLKKENLTDPIKMIDAKQKKPRKKSSRSKSKSKSALKTIEKDDQPVIIEEEVPGNKKLAAKELEIVQTRHQRQGSRNSQT